MSENGVKAQIGKAGAGPVGEAVGGFVLVPREPTEAMKVAGGREASGWIAPAMNTDSIYRAMVVAAMVEPPIGWRLVPEVPTEDQMNAGLYQASHDATYADVCQSYMDMVRTPLDVPDAAHPVEEPGEVERLTREVARLKRLRREDAADISRLNREVEEWQGERNQAREAEDAAEAALAETRERLEKEAPKWRPIEERDQIVETIQTFGEVTLRNSHPVWVRDADGRVYEAVWTVDGKGRGYWWDTEGESPVDPVAILPHPLTERAALTGDAQETLR